MFQTLGKKNRPFSNSWKLPVLLFPSFDLNQGFSTLTLKNA